MRVLSTCRQANEINKITHTYHRAFFPLTMNIEEQVSNVKLPGRVMVNLWYREHAVG